MTFVKIDPLNHLNEKEKDEYYDSLVDNRPGVVQAEYWKQHLASEEVKEFLKIYPLWNPLEFLTDLEYDMPNVELIRDAISREPERINELLPNALDAIILTQIGYGDRTFTRRVYGGPFKRRGIFYTVQLKESRAKKDRRLDIKFKIKPIRSMIEDHEPDEQILASVPFKKEAEFRKSFEPKIITALRLAARQRTLDSQICYMNAVIANVESIEF